MLLKEIKINIEKDLYLILSYRKAISSYYIRLESDKLFYYRITLVSFSAIIKWFTNLHKRSIIEANWFFSRFCKLRSDLFTKRSFYDYVNFCLIRHSWRTTNKMNAMIWDSLRVVFVIMKEVTLRGNKDGMLWNSIEAN